MLASILLIAAAAYVAVAALEVAFMRGPYLPDLDRTDALHAQHKAEVACQEIEEQAAFEETRSR